MYLVPVHSESVNKEGVTEDKAEIDNGKPKEDLARNTKPSETTNNAGEPTANDDATKKARETDIEPRDANLSEGDDRETFTDIDGDGDEEKDEDKMSQSNGTESTSNNELVEDNYDDEDADDNNGEPG